MKDKYCKFCKKFHRINSNWWIFKEDLLLCKRQEKHRKKKQKEYKKRFKNSEKYQQSTKQSRIKARYNIELVEYFQLVTIQNNKCKICNLNMKKPNIDHDHKTGKIRGLLCGHCNRGLGFFKDKVKRLENAVSYLNSAALPQ